MSGKVITNPSNAFGNPAVLDGGNLPAVVEGFRAESAITKGDAVALKFDATNFIITVEAWDTDASGQTAKLGAGVALNSAAAGGQVQVVIYGFALVNIGSGTATEGYAAKGTTTAGVVVEDTGDASDIAGEILGFFLGAEIGTTNLAPIWVSPR